MMYKPGVEPLECIWAIGKGEYPNGLISAGNIRLDTLIFEGERVPTISPTPFPSFVPTMSSPEELESSSDDNNKSKAEELWYLWLILCILFLGACILFGLVLWKKKNGRGTSGHLYVNAEEKEKEREKAEEGDHGVAGETTS